MTQLADAIEEAAKRDSTVKDRTLFAVPQNAEMLKVVRGNVEFTERALFETPKSAEPVQLCLVDPRRRCVWVASWHYIEIYDLATGSRTHHAEPGAEWMQPIGAGVMASRSSPGYHSPDGIDFWRLQYKEREVERIPAGHTWYWGMPPIALSPDEAVLATYADDKRRELTFRSSANGEEIGRCALGATASSLCFDANGRRLFAFGAVERRDWLLTAVDVESGSSLWTRKVQSDLLNEPLPSDPRVQFRDSQSRRRAHVVAYWAANDSLLVSTGSSVSELDARSGEWRRTIVAVEDRLQCLATDPSTSFSCLGNSSELLIWGPRTETIAAVEHHGDRCVDCSIANGHVAGLIGAGDERRLLTASIHGLGNRAATQAGAVSNAEIAR
jgi:hypothetical protein